MSDHLIKYCYYLELLKNISMNGPQTKAFFDCIGEMSVGKYFGIKGMDLSDILNYIVMCGNK